jgi:hypothetical protein
MVRPSLSREIAKPGHTEPGSAKFGIFLCKWHKKFADPTEKAIAASPPARSRHPSRLKNPALGSELTFQPASNFAREMTLPLLEKVHIATKCCGLSLNLTRHTGGHLTLKAFRFIVLPIC